MKPFAFGIDIGGTVCKIGLFEKSGRMVKNWEITTDTRNNGEAVLTNVAMAMDAVLKQEGISKDDVEGVGVGVPGPVRTDGTVNKCVNLGWGEINVEKELSELSGLPVRAANDANMAALGEMWKGSATGCRDILMVVVKTGVGAGIVVDGKLVYGFEGAAGEVGHICVNEEETKPCNCGKCGCLEQYASTAGIVMLAKRKLEDSSVETRLRDYGTLKPKHVYQEAQQGDAVALELLDDVGKSLGKALAMVACVVNPEVIVIGGRIANAGKPLLDTVRKYYEQNVFHACRGARLVFSKLGREAGMYGSARLIFGENEAS